MTQSGVSAFARLARRFALSAVLLFASAGALAAQTGKIEGKVRDQAGAPIQSAQVFIVGTAFSALTNAQGYYFINNVPAGTIVLRGAFIGFKKTEIEGIKILAGQTMTQDIQLERATVQLDTLVVVAGANALVPRDEVTTKQRIDGQFTENLPVDRVTQVLQLQPGVVAEGSNGQFLSIRGGRSDEAATYVDGVAVQPGNRGNGFSAAGTTASNQANGSGTSTNNAGATSASGVTLGSNGFEEVSVTTGAAAAQYGNAQAGIVNLTTRTGGSKFAGRLAAETDEVFGSTIGMGYNRFEGNLSGPLGLKGLTFALNIAGEGNESVRSGKGREDAPVFVTTGVDTTVSNQNPDGSFSDVDVNSYSIYTGDCATFASSSNAAIASNNGESCHGARLPNASFSAAQLAGNINFSYGNGSRLRLGGAGSQNQGKNYNYFNILNPNMAANQQTGFRAQNAVYTLNWTQNLSKSAERALALDVNLSYQTDRFIQSPFADGGPGSGTLGFYFSPIPLQYGFDFLDQTYSIGGETLTKLDCYIRNEKTCLGAIDLNNPDSVNAHTAQVTYRSNPYGLAQTFPDGGLSNAFLQLYKENRYVANATLDWQLDRYNRVQIGGEYVKYDMTSYAQSIASQAFSDFWAEKPVRYAAFVQDRLDIGDVVVQLGVRYDYFNTNASRWSGFPRISTNPALEPGQDPTELYVQDQSFDYISPRVQVAFPVTERTNFRLSYAQAVQSPDFALVLSGINTDISVTNTNNVYGQNVDYGKSIIFEFGIQHAFNDDMVLDISAYNRDNLANAAGRLVSSFDPLTTQNQDLRLITNSDFGNTKGLDLRLNRRFGQLFNGTIGYSYTSAQNTGTDPFTYINFGSRVVNQVTGGNQPPPQAIAPVALSRPNNLTGSLALTFPNGWNSGSTMGSILQNFQVYAVFRFATGTAYTACAVPDGNQSILTGQVCNRGGFVGGLNTERLPTFKQFDMRFVKGFNLGGSQLSLYLDARNILNFTNTAVQYVTTNSITSAIEQEQNFTADSTRNAQEGLGNGVYDEGTGAMNLTFGGAGASGCGDWVNSSNDPSVPNCVYLIRAEQRYGNGDGVYTVEEQLNASNALYYANQAAPTFFYGTGTQLRLGVEFTF
jgi:outer membrane receptor protein involved in Fe transport